MTQWCITLRGVLAGALVRNLCDFVTVNRLALCSVRQNWGNQVGIVKFLLQIFN